MILPSNACSAAWVGALAEWKMGVMGVMGARAAGEGGLSSGVPAMSTASRLP